MCACGCACEWCGCALWPVAVRLEPLVALTDDGLTLVVDVVYVVVLKFVCTSVYVYFLERLCCAARHVASIFVSTKSTHSSFKIFKIQFMYFVTKQQGNILHD